MFKPKTTITGRLENSSGEWIRTTGLRVMRPTRYKSIDIKAMEDFGILVPSSA
jgi:hypothetical protein